MRHPDEGKRSKFERLVCFALGRGERLVCFALGRIMSTTSARRSSTLDTGQVIAGDAVVASNPWTRFRGLMLRHACPKVRPSSSSPAPPST